MADAVLPGDVLQILRLSLNSSGNLIGTLANTGGVPQSEHIRKIIAAVLWHRKFILTYYLWIAAVVAISCGHEIYKRRSNKNRSKNGYVTRDPGAVEPSPSSSSSSTLIGTNTQKDDELDIDESTALLSQEEPLSYRDRPTPWERLRCFLLYQPDAIPALTSPINTLPNNGTTILILFFLGLNIFYLLYRVPLSLPWIFILSDRAGLLFVANLPILYVLAAKNNQPIRYLTGWSYEGLNIFHRRLGEWMTCFAVIHMCGMLAVWYTILRPSGLTLLRFLAAKLVFLGLCAVISYYIIYITSIGWFRHLYYEAFLGLHIFFQAAALIFLFFHYPTARPYVCVAFAIWVIDRGMWRIATSSRKFVATLEVAPDGQTVLLHVDIPLRRQKPIFGIQQNLHHGWAPGQHVFLSIPSMGFKYRFQAHPFTIASPAPPAPAPAAPQNPTNQHLRSWPLQLTIRAIDGFSLDLLKYARFHQHCEMILDGPYGSTSALQAAHAADRICFVAGGSGIAVTYPLAWDVRVQDDAKADAVLSTRTLYENGVKVMPPAVLDQGALIDESRYGHFWVRQDERHKRWITMVPKAGTVKVEPPQGIGQYSTETARAFETGQVATLITRTFDTRSPGPEGGRPDMKSEVWNWVTSMPVSTSDSSSSTMPEDGADASFSTSKGQTSKKSAGTLHTSKQKICIVVSGPDSLVRDVRNIAAELVRQGWDIDVHVEKFGW